MGRVGVATAWLARADLIVLIGLGIVVLACSTFLVAADAVTGKGQVDDRLLLMFREPGDLSKPIGPRWVEEGARDLTAVGGTIVLVLLVGAVLGFLLIGRHYSAALLVLVATGGGAVLSSFLKDFYARPRPHVVPHLSHVTSYSFPSGHSLLSAVVYLTLGALLARLVQRRWAKVYFVGVAVLLTLLVGLSRVYLGVHYPTDVVAGWSAGVTWAILCWLVARYLQNKGVVERTGT